jgi:hypothetical protein
MPGEAVVAGAGVAGMASTLDMRVLIGGYAGSWHSVKESARRGGKIPRDVTPPFCQRVPN